MSLPTKIKYSTLFILSIFFISCSSDDGLDKSLLYGDWFRVERCEDQNILTFNSNGSYSWTESLNESCESNDYPTRRTIGTYEVSGYKIVLKKVATEVIDPGVLVPDTVSQHYISSRILILTENSLQIEITYRNNDPSLPGVKVNFVFYR